MHTSDPEKGAVTALSLNTHTVSPSVCEPPHPGLSRSLTGGERQCAWSGRVLA